MRPRLSPRLSLLLALVAFALPAAAHAAGPPIMPLSEVHAGMDCTGETVVQGTTISSFDVHVIDVVQDPTQGPRILVSASGPAVEPTGIAEGFSGSPVLCPDGTGAMLTAGAISEGVGQFGNHVVLATPIQQMLGEPVLPPVDTPKFTVRGQPLVGPLVVGGLGSSWLALLQRAAQRAGRTVVAAPASAVGSFPVQDLVPGASVAASYSTGAIDVGAVGTVTYRDGQNVYAFGHELDGAGRRSILLQDAYVYYVVNNPSPGASTSYKLAAPGHTVGELTSDTPNAVIGRLGPPPATIPVDVTARDTDTGRVQTSHTQVADETNIGSPLGPSLLSTVAPLAVAQAATTIYNGPPASESGRLCVMVTLRQSQRPLRFCNRYVGTSGAGDAGTASPEVPLSAATDLSSALSIIDSESFASLHVTHLTARIDAGRGLTEGTILSAEAPARVRAGHRVRVRLRVRLYRGPLRTFTFTMRIPARAHGRLDAVITNPTSSPVGSGPAAQLIELLASALGGGTGSGTASAPQSLAELRFDFAQTAVYDGLVVRFGKRTPVPVYRNPRIVINGSAPLSFLVAGGP